MFKPVSQHFVVDGDGNDRDDQRGQFACEQCDVVRRGSDQNRRQIHRATGGQHVGEQCVHFAPRLGVTQCKPCAKTYYFVWRQQARMVRRTRNAHQVGRNAQK